MALEMRSNCEKCDTALASFREACICSDERTFCNLGSETMQPIFPNCGGELRQRPRRLTRGQS